LQLCQLKSIYIYINIFLWNSNIFGWKHIKSYLDSGYEMLTNLSTLSLMLVCNLFSFFIPPFSFKNELKKLISRTVRVYVHAWNKELIFHSFWNIMIEQWLIFHWCFICLVCWKSFFSLPLFWYQWSEFCILCMSVWNSSYNYCYLKGIFILPTVERTHDEY
jgi:hypothetical protein